MRKLDVSIPAGLDRIIGFTVPRNGWFYICDHDAVWKVEIGASPRYEITDLSPYKVVEKNSDFLGLVFEGLIANSALTQVGEAQISYHFDPEKDFVTVNYTVADRSGQIEFPILSADVRRSRRSEIHRFGWQVFDFRETLIDRFHRHK